MSEPNVIVGDRGEQVARRLLEYGGWSDFLRHPLVCGHQLDWLAYHPDYGESLIEVKVWGSPTSGKDNVKKAIADADDLRRAGEERPYILILSQDLTGIHRDMLVRAMEAGVITTVLVLTLMPLGGALI